jgi:hypothetical protein
MSSFPEETSLASGLIRRESITRAQTPRGTLLVCLFHLNLAYSSLEEKLQQDVIERCYWPMLRLVSDAAFPIGIEASGWTLQRIGELNPAWLRELRRLVEDGGVELVGGGWTQCAAPLLPAHANTWNLRLGLETYQELIGRKPRLALVSEQAFASGLVPLFSHAAYQGIIADWDNAFRSHQQWPESHRRFPQHACGGRSSIPVIWSVSVAFQKFQRFAQGDLDKDQYLEYVQRESAEGGAMVLYANDAEVFDRRPGRFAAEPPLRDSEWRRLADVLETIRESQLGQPALPSRVLGLLGLPEAGHPVRLESDDQPVPVKKQDKYNISRWACTGRDDIGVNSRCAALAMRLADSDDQELWRELLWLWSSDFRTHITDKRWQRYLERLAAFESRVGGPPTPPRARAVSSRSDGIRREGQLLVLDADGLELALNTRRGLAIERFTDRHVAPAPIVGTIPHGYFETIDLAADWYSGTLVHESPLQHKVTDLASVDASAGVQSDGTLLAMARVATELGTVAKCVRLIPEARAMEIEFELDWPELPFGWLRLGYITLLPEAFDVSTLWFAGHSGGSEPERYAISGAPFDHGGAVSSLVSCRQGLGVTEGILELGDATAAVSVRLDRRLATPLSLISFRPSRRGYLYRACFSLTETDDTRRGPILRSPETPQRFAMSLAARRLTRAA